jgi:hypothetical protein
MRPILYVLVILLFAGCSNSPEPVTSTPIKYKPNYSAFDKQTRNLLSKYKEYKNLDWVIRFHGRPTILFVTWFPDGDQTWCRQVYAEEGYVWQERSISLEPQNGWPLFNRLWTGVMHSKPKGFVAFERAVNKFPKSKLKPPYRYLMIVSFIRRGNRVTELYDRRKLPPQVIKALDLLRVDDWKPT